MQALDAVDVAAETLQSNLLEVEKRVLFPATDLVLPIGEPVAAEVASGVLHLIAAITSIILL